MMKIGVSACLLGHNVRYDGTNKKNNELISLLEKQEIVPICPETFGGLNVPHLPIEINNQKAINSKGEDTTSFINKGSKISYEKIKDCDFVILKTKSPSCGYQKIYDGTFSSKIVDGNGIFAKLCIEKGIQVYTENDTELIKKIINGD